MEHRGYVIKQNSVNRHIFISKDGAELMHIPCEELKTELELKGFVDKYESLFSRNKIDSYLKAKGVIKE